MFLISVDGGILYFRPMEIHFKPNHYLIVSSDDRMLVSWGTGVDKCEQTPSSAKLVSTDHSALQISGELQNAFALPHCL